MNGDETASNHSSIAEKISRSSDIDLFPSELLSSTKHDAFDATQNSPMDGTAAHDATFRSQNSPRKSAANINSTDTSIDVSPPKYKPEVLSTGSLKMAYVAGLYRFIGYNPY